MSIARERKDELRQSRRRRIKSAAREIFEASGYSKTSIEQVARRAELSVGAIYLYFRSKEDLYVSLVEEPLLVLAAEIDAIGASVEPEHPSHLAACWARLFSWAAREPQGVLILRALAQPEIQERLTTEVMSAVAQATREVLDALGRVIRVELGPPRAIDPDDLASVVWSLFLGVIQSAHGHTALGLAGPSLEQAAAAALHVLESGLRAMPAHVAEAA